MRTMSPEETRAFLLTETRTAHVATVRADGRPHVVPVWFTLDGDDIIFTTWHETIKARTIARDPRISLSVDDATPPFAYVTIDGRATLSDDLAALRHWATRIAERYMGAAQAEAFGQRNAIAGELLVRVTPTHVIAHSHMTE
jgi:PPOX class probable F420-dependent enzyme